VLTADPPVALAEQGLADGTEDEKKSATAVEAPSSSAIDSAVGQNAKAAEHFKHYCLVEGQRQEAHRGRKTLSPPRRSNEQQQPPDSLGKR
jgi:hypothetical protein